MNPHVWNYSDHRLQTYPDQNPPQRGVENVSLMSKNRETHSRFTAIPPHSRETSPPSRECQYPDGEQLDANQEDSELERKKKELQELNDKILYKKASIAVKTIKHIVKNPAIPGASYEEEFDLGKSETLRDRVTQILQQRQSSLFSKLQSSNERLKSSILSKERLQQEPHPLKFRVQALRTHRLGAPHVLPWNRNKVPDVPLPPPNQRINSPAEEENRGFECFVKMLNKGADTRLMEMASDVPVSPTNWNVTSPTKEENDTNKGLESVVSKEPRTSINNMVPDVPSPPPSQNAASQDKKSAAEMGFARFLGMLNKGVDVNLLSRIVKDDKEDLTNIHATRVKTKWDQAPRSESQRSNSGSSQPGCSRISSVETKTDSLQPERSLPDAKEAKNTKRSCSLDSSSQSESPHTVKKKKEVEESPKIDEKQEQLQGILKTLGLNLEVEELNRLSDRTQERLYGKKSKENQTMDNRTGQDKQQMSSHRDDRKSCSSSSSSSSTSRLSSRSFSRSPSRHRQRSHSKEKQNCSRERSIDRHQSRNEAQRHGYRNKEDILNFPHSSDHHLYQHVQSTGYCDPYSRDTNPYSNEMNPYSNEINPYSNEINPYSNEINPYSNEINPYSNEINPYSNEINPYSNGMNPYSNEMNPYNNEMNPYSREMNPYSREMNLSSDANPCSSQMNPCSNERNWSYHEQHRSNLVTVVSSERSIEKRCHNISAVMDKRFYPHNSLKDMLLGNPDLCLSKGQGGMTSASRCLMVVNNKNARARPRQRKRKIRKAFFEKNKPWACLSRSISKTDSCHTNMHPGLKVIHPSSFLTASSSEGHREAVPISSSLEARGGGNPEQLTSPASQLEKKKPLTEEEIKTNLRKKLQDFNQKAKEVKQLQNVMQPADILNSELS